MSAQSHWVTQWFRVHYCSFTASQINQVQWCICAVDWKKSCLYKLIKITVWCIKTALAYRYQSFAKIPIFETNSIKKNCINAIQVVPLVKLQNTCTCTFEKFQYDKLWIKIYAWVSTTINVIHFLWPFHEHNIHNMYLIIIFPV